MSLSFENFDLCFKFSMVLPSQDATLPDGLSMCSKYTGEGLFFILFSNGNSVSWAKHAQSLSLSPPYNLFMQSP